MPMNIGFNSTLHFFQPVPSPLWQPPPSRFTERPLLPQGAQVLPMPFGDARLNGSVPLAGHDGLPPWAGGAFAAPGAAGKTSRRDRRFVVGGRSPTRDEMPQVAEIALRDFGDELWKVKLAGQRFGIARDIRIASVKALGGRNSDLGRAFIQRCRSIARFTWWLARIERRISSQASQDNPRQYGFVIAGIVREEVEKLRRKGLSRLLCGCDLAGVTAARLKDAIDCRIRMERRNLFLPFKWLASKIWC